MILKFIKKLAEKKAVKVFEKTNSEWQKELDNLENLSIDEIKEQVTEFAQEAVVNVIELNIYLVIANATSIILFVIALCLVFLK